MARVREAARLKRSSGGRRLAAIALLGALAAPGAPADAADPPPGTVGALFNWYYAASFGTGVYKIGDEYITVLAAPLGYTLREGGPETSGIRFTMPTSVAVANFDLREPDVGAIEHVDIAALSALPGVEVTTPMGANAHLRSFANLGRGFEFRTATKATIYHAGVSSLYRFADLAWADVSLGGKFVYAGYRVSGEGSIPIAALSVGLSTAFPLAAAADGGARRKSAGFHLIGTSYMTDLKFRLSDPGRRQIHREYEIGATLGMRPAMEFLGASFDRIGLGYVIGNGGLRAVRLVTEFPF